MTGILCSIAGTAAKPPQINPTNFVKLGTANNTAGYRDTSITDGVTNSNAGMTFSAWVYPTLTGHDGDQWCILTLPNADGGNSSLYVTVKDNGGLRLYRQVPGVEGADYDPLVAGAFPTANVWYHILITSTKNANMQVYINGVQQTSLIYGGAVSNNNWRFDNLIRINVGNNEASYNQAEGDQIAQLYVDNVDADAGTNLSKFYNNGFVNMGSDGTASGLPRPLIFHQGSTTSSPAFHTSGGRTSASTGNYITYNLLDNDFGTIANGT